MSRIGNYLGNFLQYTAVIALSGTTSGAIDLEGFCLVGILLRGFTGTAITFTVCDTIDGTYVPLKNAAAGTALSYVVAQNTYAAIDPTAFQGVRFLKIVSGSTELAARNLVLSLKGL